MSTKGMTLEQKRKWVAALRSGRYRQGHGKITNKSHGQTYYCCLGVAKELFGLPSPKGAGKNAGMPHGLPYSFLSYRCQSRLMSLNDDERWSFAAIADYIEKSVPAHGE